MLTAHLLQAAGDAILAAPSPAPTGDVPAGSTIINTPKILTWFLQVIVPILLAVLGVYFVGKSRQGNVSQVVTSSGIAIVGLCFVAGALTLGLLGGKIVDLVLS